MAWKITLRNQRGCRGKYYVSAIFNLEAVIASEAKQSTARKEDWIASSLCSSQ
jgi:hypothetical protein